MIAEKVWDLSPFFISELSTGDVKISKITTFRSVSSADPNGTQLFTKYFTHKSADTLHLGINQMRDAGVWDFRTAFENDFGQTKVKEDWELGKSGWKSIVASSVCSTLCNRIVMQSITHSFSANHHLILIRLESGGCPPVHHKADRPFICISNSNSSLLSI